MESHIDRILNGEFVYAHPSLVFPEKKLELTVYENESTEGCFSVLSEDEAGINGTIVSSDPRMQCDSVTVEKGRAEVHYSFRAKGLEEGSVVKGFICLISEEGEYKLPFSVSVVMKYPDSSVGSIKNLFHFTNLARNHFDEAVNIFYSPEMINVFQKNDLRFKNLYRAFSVYPQSSVNVEEFLISVHKKSPVIFTTDPERADITDYSETGKSVLRIRKSGWGYIRISVHTEGNFIRLEKDEINEQDFQGDLFLLNYTIDREALHRGKNPGAIILKSFSSEIRFVVNADLTDESIKKDNAKTIRRNKWIAELLSAHIGFRLKNKDLAAFCNDTERIADKMIEEDSRDIFPRLVKTHVYLLEGRDRDADLLLSQIENELLLGNTPYEEECFYKYLKAVNKRDRSFSRQMSEEVSGRFKEHPDSVFLLNILIFLDEELGDQADKRMEALSRIFLLGSRSPLLYIEMLRALSENPGDIKKEGYSVIYSLYWGVKNGVYLESLISHIISLSYGMKGYSPIFLRVLKAYYEKFGTLELLEAVCSLIIRERGGRKKDPDDFKWLMEAVKNGLKITRLYESFLNSVPDDYEPLLPETILRYFSIGASLGDDRMAMFYSNIIRNARKAGDILKENDQRIVAFAIKEAESLKISSNLAVIYEYVATAAPRDLSDRFMLAVSPLIFTHEIRVEDPEVRSVIAVEDGFSRERAGVVTGGRTFLSFYGGDSEVIVEYGDMRRLIAKKGITDKPLINPARFAAAIRFGLLTDPGHAWYVCGSGRHGIQVDKANEVAVKALASAKEIENNIRNECLFALIRFYSDNDRLEELDQVLEDMDVSKVSGEVRAEIARLYVSRGMHRKVYDLIKEYGSEGVDPVVLVRLAGCMISEGINTEDPTLLNISFEALKKGKYDENILKYLCDEFRGTVKELRDVWRAASSFGTDSVKLEERILSQMLYSGAFVSDREDIVLSCIKNNGRERITTAFLDYLSYEYFVKKSIIDSRIFKALSDSYRRNNELSDMSALAVLKYYSGDEYDGDGYKKLLSPLIDQLLNKNIIFSFFRDYREYAPSLSLYHDRTFVEYRTGPGKRVMIHYCIFDEDTEKITYVVENMDEICQGIYTRDFVLFYGEKLQYYITEEDGDEMMPTESEEIERDITAEMRTDSRYDLINDMLLSESVSDDPSLKDLMEQYLMLTEKVEEFF